MIDWQDKVDRPHLVCALSGAPIPPGALFVSVLRLAEGRFVREDVLAECWDPEQGGDYVSWWKQRRPEPTADHGPRLVNHAVLLSIFNDLKESTERPQQCFAWLLALLLTRARKLRYLDLEREGGESWMLVEEKARKIVHRIRDPRMTAAEEERVQEDLQQVFTDPGPPVETETADTAPSAAEHERVGEPVDEDGTDDAEGEGDDATSGTGDDEPQPDDGSAPDPRM